MTHQHHLSVHGKSSLVELCTAFGSQTVRQCECAHYAFTVGQQKEQYDLELWVGLFFFLRSFDVDSDLSDVSRRTRVRVSRDCAHVVLANPDS